MHVYENKEKETDLKSRDKGKEDRSHSQQIKLNNFNVSFLDERKEVLLKDLVYNSPVAFRSGFRALRQYNMLMLAQPVYMCLNVDINELHLCMHFKVDLEFLCADITALRKANS